MSKQDPSDQIKFLVACITRASNGKPDFAGVAQDLGIVSKAAAAKRYERLVKAHTGPNTSTSNAEDNAEEEPPVTPGKKRKTALATPDSSVKKPRARAKKQAKPAPASPKSDVDMDQAKEEKPEEEESEKSDAKPPNPEADETEI